MTGRELENRWRSASMTGERQVTCLLAVLASWLNAYQCFQDTTVDRLSLEEISMLVASAESEVARDLPTAAMNGAIWRIQWAALTTAELGRDPHPCNPADAIVGLLRAAAAVLTCWRDSHGEGGFELDGQRYGSVSGEYVQAAREHTVDALAAVDRLLGPTIDKS